MVYTTVDVEYFEVAAVYCLQFEGAGVVEIERTGKVKLYLIEAELLFEAVLKLGL